jgi:hypothetical protein
MSVKTVFDMEISDISAHRWTGRSKTTVNAISESMLCYVVPERMGQMTYIP